MTQKHVELVIGRLVTDEDFRKGFQRNPAAALETLAAMGIELNRVEREALLELDSAALEVLMPTLSPRLQRAALPKAHTAEDEEGRNS
jgi:hypothetical protein